MLVRGAEPMEKRQRRILFVSLSSRHLSLFLSAYVPITPAAAERQERSDRVSEEASFHRYLYFALTLRSDILSLQHEALS
ncbi:hypothetical protein DV721_28155 [Klebsiella pneumoniae]|nr:hypothetical protein [Salmonella enterica subsp. enterica serovar Cerro]EEW9831855.1 hypothetical protein [Salmonella enterica subsp. enterica]EHK1615716.1 hypothetical protein [Escherichia coli]EIW8495378.1 hypothetical protein [Klebsiella pneumoniae]HDX7764282.1 hypothetical protein [Escherichia coli]